MSIDMARKWAQQIGNQSYESTLDDIALLVQAAMDEASLDAAKRADAAEAEVARLRAQAQSISVWLSEAGCPAMPIDAGVRWLLQRVEAAEAEVARLNTRAEHISREEATELQDILRTLTNSGVALATSARALVARMRAAEAALSAERAKRYPHWTCRTHGDFDARVAVGCPECVRELRSSLAADDERLRAAAAKAGVIYVGCDTPDELADAVVELQRDGAQ